MPNSGLVKLKMINGLIGSILDDNHISLTSLFPKLPEVDIDKIGRAHV